MPGMTHWKTFLLFVLAGVALFPNQLLSQASKGESVQPEPASPALTLFVAGENTHVLRNNRPFPEAAGTTAASSPLSLLSLSSDSLSVSPDIASGETYGGPLGGEPPIDNTFPEPLEVDSVVIRTASSAPVLTLDEAIARALSDNLGLKTQGLEIKKTADRVRQARRNLKPKTSVSLINSKTLIPGKFRVQKDGFGPLPIIGYLPPIDREFEGGKEFSSWGYVSIAQPLSQLGRIRKGIDLYKVTGQKDEARLRELRLEIIAGVRKQYYGLLGIAAALQASGEYVKQLRELARNSEDAFQQGALQKFELLEVQAQCAEAENRTKSLLNSLQSGKESLNDLMGCPLEGDFAMVASLASGALPIPEAIPPIPAEIGSHPVIQQSLLAIRQAMLDRKVKEGEFQPQMNLTLDHITAVSQEVLSRPITTVGLLVTWDPFEGGRRRGALDEKSRTIEQAKLELERKEKSTRREMLDLQRKLEEAKSAVETTFAHKLAAREKSRVTFRRFQEKAALLKDVLTASATFGEALRRYQQETVNYWTVLADYEKALGVEE
ncbi:MAG: TolC family protein [Candidatus Ozemobacteraceae bacterium]